MGLLNWLLDEAVEAPGVALERSAGFSSRDPADTAFNCTDYSDYLRKRQERIDATAERLKADYANAQERARVVCEQYAADLDKRRAELDAAEEAFMARRTIVIAALRDSNNMALANVIATEAMTAGERRRKIARSIGATL